MQATQAYMTIASEVQAKNRAQESTELAYRSRLWSKTRRELSSYLKPRYWLYPYRPETGSLEQLRHFSSVWSS